ncbi:peptide/nickel transport system ATP-binding protein [Rhodoligotrophos appendicifer]|uniref:ABC transporter ATP-binding protein n=1 Tax=Rhodoligotrophos appendicifer TaxID=987056 RepID=UPI001185E0C1|nr:ABC transporter ATP-binding protein [Rhodoligotrophos appendicifer]
MTAALAVEDLTVRFRASGRLTAWLEGTSGWIEAVAGVSFSVAEGETYALVGESGSGKTTLARAVGGLLPIHSGSIRFRGREIAEMSAAELVSFRSELAMMFQDPVGSLSPRLTVSALLAEPFKVHGRGGDLKAEAERLLGLVGLPAGFASRYPHQLSGGQARRVGVARALALEPAMVIADEPTAGLDVSIQGEVLNLLNALQDRMGLTILIITHNLNVVRHVAGRMGIMYLGRIVEEGTTEEIFDHPRHPYTLALLSANPEPDPDAVHDRITLKGDVPSLLNRPSGCEFHTRCPFVQDKCRIDAPAMVQENGRRFSCHFPR